MKRQIIYINFYLLMIFVSISCKDELNTVIKDQSTLDKQERSDVSSKESLTSREKKIVRYVLDKDYKIPQEEAANIALSFLDGTGKSTRSFNNRTIDNVQFVTTSSDVKTPRRFSENQTKSALDTLAYVFNFSNNKGYSIVSADRRLEESVFCFVEKGAIDLNNVTNPGLVSFLSKLNLYLNQRIAYIQKEINDLTPKIENKIKKEELKSVSLGNAKSNGKTRYNIEGSDYDRYGKWEVSEVMAPIIPVVWGQGTVFNDSVRFRNCSAGSTPAGCVAVAIGQIMAYWKYPKYIPEKKLDIYWDIIHEYTAFNLYGYGKGEDLERTKNYLRKDKYQAPPYIARSISMLLAFIGEKVKMQYSCNSSAAYPGAAADFLSHIGYRSTGFHDFSEEKAYRALKRKVPILVTGISLEKEAGFFRPAVYGAHMWIIDGYIRKTRTVTYVPPLNGGRFVVEYEHQTLFHSNWGWEGAGNGYYLAFDMNKRETPPESFIPQGKTSRSINSNYDIRDRMSIPTLPYLPNY